MFQRKGMFAQIVTRFAALLFLPFVLVISGCANMPKGIADSLSQVPGVSMMVDSNTVSDMSRRLEEDTISEPELRDILRRPVPPAPGISYEIGLLRKALAAYALVDLAEVRRIDEELRRNSKNQELLDSLRLLRISAESQSGNFRQAISLVNGVRANWMEESRRLGKSPIYTVSRVLAYSSAVDLGLGAGDTVFLESLLTEFPKSIDEVGGMPTVFKIQYRSKRVIAAAGVSMLRGDLESARIQLEAGEKEAIERLSSLVPKDELEKKNIAVGRAIFRGMRFGIELSIGNLAKARSLLEEHEHDPRSEFAKSMHGWYASYFGATKNYQQAIAATKKSMEVASQLERRIPISQAGYAANLAQWQIYSGDYKSANETLNQLPVAKIPEAGSLASRYSAMRAYLALKLSSEVVRTAAFERFNSTMVAKAGTEDAIFHYGAGVIVYEGNFRRTGSSADLAKAVISGRAFSQSLRRIRASGLNRDLSFPDKQVLECKAAYLNAVSASFGKGGVTSKDLIDAITLYQESDTDKDIAASALRQKQIPGVSADDLRKLQDLQVAARAAQKGLGNVGLAADANPADIAAQDKKTRDAFQQLETHIARLQLQAPSLASLVSSEAPSLTSIQARLSDGEALAILAPHENGTVAVIITKTGFTHKALPITERRAAELVKGVRKTLTFDNDVVPFDTRSATILHSELLAWAQPHLARTNQVVVVPTGTLASIPFGLLLTGPNGSSDYRAMPWLVKSFAIVHSPSIGAWLGTSSGTGRRPNSFLAWADPDFGEGAPVGSASTRGIRKAVRSLEVVPGFEQPPLAAASLSGRLERLPETKFEVDAIARTLRANALTDVISGGRATRSSVLASSASGTLASKSVVMFATHGLAPGQVAGLLQPALAMAREQDRSTVPLLQLDDVVGLRMNADWVVLSACNTSAADKAGGDAMSGLARGFFFAGAKSILVTHWEVESESAAALTVKTMEKYMANTSVTRARALQLAAIEMIEAKRSDPEWSHPVFWAPYALVGNGQR